MKTATLPPIRVAPEFRLELEGVLEQGESLSQFVEDAVRSTVAKRKNQAEFIRRGIAAIEATQRDGSGIPANVVIAKLEAKLAGIDTQLADPKVYVDAARVAGLGREQASLRTQLEAAEAGLLAMYD